MSVINFKKIYNKRIYLEDTKKSIGKIDALVFFEKKCIGIIVKRSDILLMIPRKNMLLPFSEVSFKNDTIKAKSKNLQKLNKITIENNKLDIEKLTIFLGFDIVFEKKSIGSIGNVFIDKNDGKLEGFSIEHSVLEGVVLGDNLVLAGDIKDINISDRYIELKEDTEIHRINSGIADKAGKTASYILHKSTPIVKNTVDNIQEQSNKIHKMFNEFTDELKKGMK